MQKRKAQNRASQRAFRERKQDYLASLEQKIQAYENAEVTKTIELQKIARGVNQENDKLREENTKLKQICQNLTMELNRWKAGVGIARSVNEGKPIGKNRDNIGCKAPSHESQGDTSASMIEADRDASGPSRPVRSGNVDVDSSVTSSSSSNSGESFPLDGMGPSTSKLRSLSLESNSDSKPHQHVSHHSLSSSSIKFMPSSSLGKLQALPSQSREREISQNRTAFDGLKPCADIDRDCGFCTENSPCVCAGEADLDLNEQEDSGSILTKQQSQPAMSVGSLLGPTSSPGFSISKSSGRRSQINASETQESQTKRSDRASKPRLWDTHPVSPIAGPSSSIPTSSAKPKLWPTIPARFSNVETDPSLSHVSSFASTSKLRQPNSASAPISLPCSGDPSTCSACSTDPGLAAFCEAINRNLDGTLSSPAILDVGNSMRIRSRTENQPFKTEGLADRALKNRERSLTSGDSVQLQVRKSGSKLWPAFPPTSTSFVPSDLPKPSLPMPSPSSGFSGPRPLSSMPLRAIPLPHRRETIPEAWAQIRSHPRFDQWGGGLSLLADVVSGRSAPSSSRSNSDSQTMDRRRRAPSVEIVNDDHSSNSTNSTSRPILQRKLSITRGTTSDAVENRNVNVDPNLKLAPLSSLHVAPIRSTGGQQIRFARSTEGDSELRDLLPEGQSIPPKNQDRELQQTAEADGGRGSKRRRLYVETDAVRDALALLDGGLPPREEDETRSEVKQRRAEVTNGNGQGSCPCPWKPSV